MTIQLYLASALTAFFSKFPDLVKMFGFLEAGLVVSALLCGVVWVRDGEWGRETLDACDEGCDSEGE